MNLMTIAEKTARNNGQVLADLFALLIATTTYLPNIYLAIYFASYFIIWESLYPYLGAFNFGCPPILEVIFPR